jgi:hypothetical protein
MNSQTRISGSYEDWNWLLENLKIFLEKINRSELFDEFANRNLWQLLVALTPHEKNGQQKRSMRSFIQGVWEKELGRGGLIGDLTNIDRRFKAFCSCMGKPEIYGSL